MLCRTVLCILVVSICVAFAVMNDDWHHAHRQHCWQHGAVLDATLHLCADPCTAGSALKPPSEVVSSTAVSEIAHVVDACYSCAVH